MFSLSGKKSDNKIEVTVSNRTVIRVLGLVIVSLIALTAFRQMSHALVLIFTAFFLALSLNAPVHWIERHLPGAKRGRDRRTLATVVSVLLVMLILVGFIASIVPPLSRQVGSLINSAPEFVRDLRNQNSEVGHLIQRYHLQSQVDTFSNEFSSRIKGLSGEAVSVVTRVSSSAISVLTILVLTFMMLVEGPRWVSIAQRLTPPSKRKHLAELSRGMYKVIKGYVNGQVLLAAIASLFIVPVLFILHVSYPWALMVIVFICGLIPMVGHTIGALIVTSVALFRSPLVAAIVLGYYILYQQIENYLVQPRIQANTTNMSPLLVFVAVVLGVSFGGLLGGLVAIPIMGCIRIIVVDQLTRRNLIESETAEKTISKAESKKAK
jgi:predicted PurR-regulated permease PerM